MQHYVEIGTLTLLFCNTLSDAPTNKTLHVITMLSWKLRSWSKHVFDTVIVPSLYHQHYFEAVIVQLKELHNFALIMNYPRHPFCIFNLLNTADHLSPQPSLFNPSTAWTITFHSLVFCKYLFFFPTHFQFNFMHIFKILFPVLLHLKQF